MTCSTAGTSPPYETHIIQYKRLPGRVPHVRRKRKLSDHVWTYDLSIQSPTFRRRAFQHTCFKLHSRYAIGHLYHGCFIFLQYEFYSDSVWSLGFVWVIADYEWLRSFLALNMLLWSFWRCYIYGTAFVQSVGSVSWNAMSRVHVHWDVLMHIGMLVISILSKYRYS